MSLQDYLHTHDANYDDQEHLVWCNAQSPGYHTRIPDGKRAHQTRQAMDYAIALLQSGEPDRVNRAHEVIEKILSLQVTDPTVEHYGIWGWFFEEPPQQMSPADWNWADFIGTRLVQVLVVHGRLIRPDTAKRIQQSLHHAALSIFRRNVHSGYTNIAVMGAVVSAAVGEILHLPFLLDYGNRRLANVLALVEKTGGFAEYNSPAYTRVVLEETERTAILVRDPTFLSTSERLRSLAWQAMSERFHPGTGQLAGPMSRAYSDWVNSKLARYFSEQTQSEIVCRRAGDAHLSLATDAQVELVPPLPCPRQYVERFRALPKDPLQIISRFSSGPNGDVIGTSWFTAEACLGSTNVEFAWTQRRILLGYWKTPADPAVMLRLRMLLNGRDLSAAFCRQAQNGPRVLTAWWLTYDSGHFHPSLDKMPESIFPTEDLRLRIELKGVDVRAGQINDHGYELSAGHWRAVVHTAPASFMNQPARWEISQNDGLAHLDAILYHGPKQMIDFHQAVLNLAHAIELLPASQALEDHPLQASSTDETNTHWSWRDLAVSVPKVPTPFKW